MSTDLATLVPGLGSLEEQGWLKQTSLDLPNNIDLDQFSALGQALGLLGRAAKWWIGDWIIYGEDTYGEKFSQAAELTGHSVETLMRYVRVARAIPPSRRFEDLSFSIHSVVAPMEPKEQKKWLKTARREGISQQADLRRLIREHDLTIENGNGSQASRTPEDKVEARDSRESGLPEQYVIPGPLCRRLVRESVSGDDGFFRVPRDLISRLAGVIGEDV